MAAELLLHHGRTPGAEATEGDRDQRPRNQESPYPVRQTETPRDGAEQRTDEHDANENLNERAAKSHRSNYRVRQGRTQHERARDH